MPFQLIFDADSEELGAEELEASEESLEELEDSEELEEEEVDELEELDCEDDSEEELGATEELEELCEPPPKIPQAEIDAAKATVVDKSKNFL